MNSDEIKIIKTTWEIPKATPTDSGAAILTKFFTRYPSNLEKFPKFNETPVAELNKNPRFRAHAGRIIRTFDESIEVLGEAEGGAKLEEIWSTLAKSHFKRQIEKRAYIELREIILEVLTEVCQLDEEQAAAWTKLTDTVYGIIFKTMDHIEQNGLSEEDSDQ